MERILLAYDFTWSGHCQVHYKAGKKLYCLQLQGRNGDFRLLSCTKDDEPSHEVDITRFDIPESPGDERIDEQCNVFLRERAAQLSGNPG